jgi:hypothetical protein
MLAYVTVASVIFTSSALLLSWVRINLLNVEEFYSYDIQMWPPKKTYSWSAHTSFEKSETMDAQIFGCLCLLLG